MQRRRALGPSVFFTPWSYVDHMLMAPGATTPETRYADMTEAYYVMSR